MSNLDRGMNIAEIESLGHRLQDRYAAELRSIASDLTRTVGGSPGLWLGGDANNFRGWWPAKKARLLAVAEDLHGFGQSALNNAAEQRAASGEGVASDGVGSLPWGRSGGVPASQAGPLPNFQMPFSLAPWLHNLEKGGDAVQMLPFFGLGIPAAGGIALGGSPEVSRLMKIGNGRVRIAANHVLGRPIDPKLSGALGGNTAAAYKYLDGSVKGFNRSYASGAALSGAVSATEVLMLAQEKGWGDADTISAEVTGVYKAGAEYFGGPIGGIVAEGSMVVGEEIFNLADSTLKITDHSVDSFMIREFGKTDGLTTAQANQVVERYKGWSGFRNATYDSVVSFPGAVLDKFDPFD